MENNLLFYLYEAYSEPHRKYHSLTHIAEIFNTVRKKKIKLLDCQVVAIWFHNVVYQIPCDNKHTNKQQSASYAFDYSMDEYGKETAIKIGTIIEDLDNHTPTIDESKVVIDLNLWDYISIELSCRRRKLIEAEYKGADKLNYYYERQRIMLTNILERKNIYWSEYITSIMEKKARMNMNSELNEIGGPLKKKVKIKKQKNCLGDTFFI